MALNQLDRSSQRYQQSDAIRVETCGEPARNTWMSYLVFAPVYVPRANKPLTRGLGKQTMKTITVEDRIAAVADRWKVQYFGSQWQSDSKMDVWSRLKALPEDATAAQIESIIGNDSWTVIMCDECGRHVEMAIVLNEGEDYHTFTVCAGCLDLAQLLLHSL